jgi:hypothetical protein
MIPIVPTIKGSFNHREMNGESLVGLTLLLAVLVPVLMVLRNRMLSPKKPAL